MHKLLILFMVAATALPLTVGCATTDNRVSTVKQIAPKIQQTPIKNRIIIKFKNSNINPLQPGFVEGLSRDANAEISYLRPMPGDAHVFLVETIGGRSSLEKIIQQLSKRSDVLYIEQDTIMRHQQ